MTQHRSASISVAALALGLVLTATLSGCTGAGSSAASPRGGVSDSAPSGSGTSSSSTATTPLSGEAVEGGSTKAVSPVDREVAGRDVVSTGTISLTVDRPTDAGTRAVHIVESAGGRVDDRTEHAATKGDHGSASLTLRIPSAKLTPTLAQLRALGKVENVSISARDVTAERTDLDARVTALRASVDRLVELMSRSATTADLITIESALSQRQSDLESLEAQQAALGGQIALATITLQLRSVAPAPPAPAPADFLSGLAIGWNALLSFVTALVVVIGVVLPWALPPALVASVVLLLVRRRRARAA